MAIEVLSALDKAKMQYYHFQAIVVAGMGLFTDAYDFFCIPAVMRMVGRIYYERTATRPGVTPPAVLSASVAIALAGTAAGQLIFGRLGDKRGRRYVYGLALLIMVLSSLGCGFSICRTRPCVLVSLCFFRFLLGLGIGGDYPLSATIMSEFANRRTRGSFIAAVFSMQGFGILTSSGVIMAVTAAFRRAGGGRVTVDLDPPPEADLAWRVILMLGAVPAAVTFYWRMSMPETARYTALVELNPEKATQDMQQVLGGIDLEPDTTSTEETPRGVHQKLTTYPLLSRGFLREHGHDLATCAANWFLLDVVFYSSSLFQSHIYEAFFHDSGHDIYQEAFHVAKFQAIIALASSIPGYLAAVFLIDRVGRKKLQAVGFFLMAAFLFAIGGPYRRLWEGRTSKPGFVVLYAVTFFFANMGPNTTTFIVPAEMFPARFRSTCHGIAGAAGKVGAALGAVGFLWASQDKNENKRDPGYRTGIGMMASLLLLAGVCVMGTVVTVLFTRETRGISLEENEIPDDDGNASNTGSYENFVDGN